MAAFMERLRRLLVLAERPLPGDRVHIGERARKPELRGKVGTVREVWVDANVEIDGAVHHLVSNSLEVINDEG